MYVCVCVYNDRILYIFDKFDGFSPISLLKCTYCHVYKLPVIDELILDPFSSQGITMHEIITTRTETKP